MSRLAYASPRFVLLTSCLTRARRVSIPAAILHMSLYPLPFVAILLIQSPLGQRLSILDGQWLSYSFFSTYTMPCPLGTLSPLGTMVCPLGTMLLAPRRMLMLCPLGTVLCPLGTMLCPLGTLCPLGAMLCPLGTMLSTGCRMHLGTNCGIDSMTYSLHRTD